MKKLIILLALLLLVGCTQRPEVNSELAAEVSSIVKDKSNGELNLNSLTDFTWDRAKLFGPYTPQKTIEESLDIRYRQTGGIETREDIFLLIFLKDGHAVQYALLDRQSGIDFNQQESFITPSNDVIKFNRVY